MKYGLQCYDGRRDMQRYDDRRSIEWALEACDKYTKCGPHLIVGYSDGD